MVWGWRRNTGEGQMKRPVYPLDHWLMGFQGDIQIWRSNEISPKAWKGSTWSTNLSQLERHPVIICSMFSRRWTSVDFAHFVASFFVHSISSFPSFVLSPFLIFGGIPSSTLPFNCPFLSGQPFPQIPGPFLNGYLFLKPETDINTVSHFLCASF